MNLLVNARDAMTQGGSLILECHNAVRPETSAGKAAEDYVCLRVTDTGRGSSSVSMPSSSFCASL